MIIRTMLLGVTLLAAGCATAPANVALVIDDTCLLTSYDEGPYCEADLVHGMRMVCTVRKGDQWLTMGRTANELCWKESQIWIDNSYRD